MHAVLWDSIKLLLENIFKNVITEATYSCNLHITAMYEPTEWFTDYVRICRFQLNVNLNDYVRICRFQLHVNLNNYSTNDILIISLGIRTYMVKCNYSSQQLALQCAMVYA